VLNARGDKLKVASGATEMVAPARVSGVFRSNVDDPPTEIGPRVPEGRTLKVARDEPARVSPAGRV
jgi:hypothetical protein